MIRALTTLKEQIKIDRENGLAIVGMLDELDDPDLQYGLQLVITRLADAALFAIDSISAEDSKGN